MRVGKSTEIFSQNQADKEAKFNYYLYMVVYGSVSLLFDWPNKIGDYKNPVRPDKIELRVEGDHII